MITTESFRNSWEKMKEVTVLEISGDHFGYMKACAQSEALSNFKATNCHISYATGYLLKDWKTVVNIIIEKKGKRNRVGNLRTINLMEADFNFNNKIMAREVLFCMEKNKLLQDKQYSSRY